MTPQNSSPPTATTLRRVIFLALAAIFLALAIGSNEGRYSPAGMTWLSLAIAATVLGVFAPDLVPRIPATRRALHGVLGAGAVLFAALTFVPSRSANFWPQFGAALLICALLGAMVLRLSRWPLLNRALFPILLLMQLVVGASTLSGARHFELTSPLFSRFHVRNDVQIFAEIAAQRLSAGQNPYSIRMPNVMGADLPFYAAGATGADGKLPFGYPYLPLSALISLPGYWLGDFRFAHLFALVATAALLAYARPSTTSKLAATLFLLFPSTVFVLLMSWIEPVVLVCLGATLFCHHRAPKWLWVALGCMIASKQYAFFVLFLLPILVPEAQKWRPLLFKSIGVALLLTLPMALWDVGGFYRSVVEIQFKQPFRTDSLSYLVTVLNVGGPKLSPFLGFGALGIALFLASRAARRDVLKRTAAFWCGASALAYLGFFAFNKQAFANYYFWPFGLLVAAVAVALPEDTSLAPTIGSE